MKKVVHYINQFFAGVGGEDQADFEPTLLAELSPQSKLLNSKLEGSEVVATIVCGDNFFGENTEEAKERLVELLKDIEFDILVAGPAFRAGRYGFACGGAAMAIKEAYDVDVFTSMNEENPGVEMWKKSMYVFKGGASAAKTKVDVECIANAVNKVVAGETLGTADEENFFPRGKRHIDFSPIEMSSKRAVDMVVAKVTKQEFVTELPIPDNDLVPIAPAIKDLSKIKIAYVTSGGIVPVDNPDRIQSASATRWGMYDISKIDRLAGKDDSADVIYKTIHAGYDPAAADTDPNCVVPVDVLKELEKDGIIGSVDTHFYTTVGTGTTENEAKRMGLEIAEVLHDHGVDAVFLTST